MQQREGGEGGGGGFYGTQNDNTADLWLFFIRFDDEDKRGFKSGRTRKVIHEVTVHTCKYT